MSVILEVVTHSGSTGLTLNPKIEFKDATLVETSIYKLAISAINAATGWTHYNESIFEYVAENPQNAHLAILGDKIVGYALYKPEKQMLSYISVDSSYRGAHIGSTLIDKVITVAKSLGKDSLTWDYREKEGGPGPFYDKILSSLSGIHAEKKPAGTYLDGTPKTCIKLSF
jgi:GNAT superfamily N-acetyltransferase